MARKTKSETQKTIEGILDAAEFVFVEKGVASTTMADLAARAGVSRGAVYGHFEDKMQVCIAACARAMATTAAIHPPQPDRPALTTLMDWGLNYLRCVHTPSSLRRALEILYVKCELSPEYQPLIRIRLAWEKMTQRATALLLRRAVDSGELPADLNKPLANAYLQSMLTGVSTNLWFSGLDQPGCWQQAEKLLAIAIQTLQVAPQFHLPAPPTSSGTHT